MFNSHKIFAKAKSITSFSKTFKMDSSSIKQCPTAVISYPVKFNLQENSHNDIPKIQVLFPMKVKENTLAEPIANIDESQHEKSAYPITDVGVPVKLGESLKQRILQAKMVYMTIWRKASVLNYTNVNHALFEYTIEKLPAIKDAIFQNTKNGIVTKSEFTAFAMQLSLFCNDYSKQYEELKAVGITIDRKTLTSNMEKFIETIAKEDIKSEDVEAFYEQNLTSIRNRKKNHESLMNNIKKVVITLSEVVCKLQSMRFDDQNDYYFEIGTTSYANTVFAKQNTKSITFTPAVAQTNPFNIDKGVTDKDVTDSDTVVIKPKKRVLKREDSDDETFDEFVFQQDVKPIKKRGRPANPK